VDFLFAQNQKILFGVSVCGCRVATEEEEDDAAAENQGYRGKQMNGFNGKHGWLTFFDSKIISIFLILLFIFRQHLSL
jgi:ferredoxin-thioredoxin reductase catalytic subunit